MRQSIALLAPLLLIACTAEQPAPETASASPQGAQMRCIDATRVAGRRAESNRALIFEMNDGRVFRNQLQNACPSAERASSFGTLAIDPVETRLCRNDMIRVYDPADLPVGGLKGVARCRLGGFTQVAAR